MNFPPIVVSGCPTIFWWHSLSHYRSFLEWFNVSNGYFNFALVQIRWLGVGFMDERGPTVSYEWDMRRTNKRGRKDACSFSNSMKLTRLCCPLRIFLFKERAALNTNVFLGPSIVFEKDSGSCFALASFFLHSHLFSSPAITPSEGNIKHPCLEVVTSFLSLHHFLSCLYVKGNHEVPLHNKKEGLWCWMWTQKHLQIRPNCGN